MELCETRKFLDWYKSMAKKDPLQFLPYKYGNQVFVFTDKVITNIQLVVLGVVPVSIEKMLALEAYLQMFNEINDSAIVKRIDIPRRDMF